MSSAKGRAQESQGQSLGKPVWSASDSKTCYGFCFSTHLVLIWSIFFFHTEKSISFSPPFFLLFSSSLSSEKHMRWDDAWDLMGRCQQAVKTGEHCQGSASEVLITLSLCREMRTEAFPHGGNTKWTFPTCRSQNVFVIWTWIMLDLPWFIYMNTGKVLS